MTMPTKMPTLNEFLSEGHRLVNEHRFPQSKYVREPGFKSGGIYVRKTWQSCGDADEMIPVVCLANISASRPGHGAFTALVVRLHKDHNLVVECVSTERFENKLARMGFCKLQCGGGFPSYYLTKQMRLRTDG